MARAARSALEMMASVRPPVFITVMNMEITRHNSLIQSAQTLNVNLNNGMSSARSLYLLAVFGNIILYFLATIVRAKDELLRILDMLINKHPQAVADLIVEVSCFSKISMLHHEYLTAMT
jgi:hypothetical protein